MLARSTGVFAAAAATLLLVSAPLRAVGDGELDPDFGSGGLKVVSLASGQHAAMHAIRSGPQGVLTVAGDLTVDGSLDTDFFACTLSADGTSSSCIEPAIALDVSHFDEASAVAYQLDGRRVLAGIASGPAADSDPRPGFAGLAAGNTLDTGFDGDGTKTIDFASGARAVAISARRDGDLLFTGRYGHEATAPGTGTDCVVGRMHEDGMLDAGFSGNGLVTVGWDLGPDATDDCVAQALYHDGRVVVAAHVQRADGTHTFGVARVTTDGNLDSTFSGNGKRMVSLDLPGGGWSDAAAVALDHLGRIVVAGLTSTATGHRLAVARLLADGGLDPSFGTAGKLYLSINGTSDDVESVAGVRILPPPANDIVIGGSSELAHEAGFVVVLHDDGSFDDTFAGDGRRTLDLDPTNGNVISGLTLQGGKIVLSSGRTGRLAEPQHETTISVYRLYMNRIFGDDFEGGDRQLWSNFADP